MSARTLLGLALIGLTLFGLHLGDRFGVAGVALAQGAVYAIAAWLVLREKPDSARALTVILLIGAALRLAALPLDPISTDLWRYIWDGRVQAAGINPYRYLPASDALAFLRDATVYPQINRAGYAPTIYPPAAQIVFFLITRISESALAIKLGMVAFEAVAVWAILALLKQRGLPRGYVLLYAWHPLPVWEFAGNGHLDAIAIAFLLLAFVAADRRLPFLSGAALAGATFVKYLPIVAAPAIAKRWDWRAAVGFLLAAVLLYLPYLGVGSKVLGFASGYYVEEGFDRGVGFYLWELLGGGVPLTLYMALATAAFIALALTLFLRRDEPGADIALAMILAVAAMMIVTPHYPWYFAWLVPFLCFYPVPAVLWLTIGASYLHFLYWAPTLAQGAVLYGPFFALLAGEPLYRRFIKKEFAHGRVAAA